MKTIGFIGVGSMGAGMAMRLVEAGYAMTVCDKRVKALGKFEEIGIRVTQKAADCVDNEIIIVMVVDDDQVKEVVLGPDGILNAVDPNRSPLVAVMSTVLPQTTEELGASCEEKSVRLVDAPVGGMPVAAAQGKLNILAGGTEADIDALRPLFEVLGESTHHTGPLGSGNIIKLVNNIISIPNVLLTAEAMRIGKRWGMDPFHSASIVSKSTGLNWLTKDWDRGRATFEFYSRELSRCEELFDILRKDLMHAQELAAIGHIDCPFLDQIVKALQRSSCDDMKEQWRALL